MGERDLNHQFLSQWPTRSTYWTTVNHYILLFLLLYIYTHTYILVRKMISVTSTYSQAFTDTKGALAPGSICCVQKLYELFIFGRGSVSTTVLFSCGTSSHSLISFKPGSCLFCSEKMTGTEIKSLLWCLGGSLVSTGNTVLCIHSGREVKALRHRFCLWRNFIINFPTLE